MSHRKVLALTAIVSSVFVLDACVVAPPNQNYNPGQGYNQPGYGSAPVNVSDLYNSAEGYARQQLGARGFQQVGEQLGGQFNNSWWLNANTHQCFQLETADGKVMTLNSIPPGNCHAPNGQQGNAQNPSTGLPQAAKAACFGRFGEPGYQRIKMVSPLKPGFWEVIILGRQGRQVACTVDQYGSITDWVNM
jgi:hypothetical protein